MTGLKGESLGANICKIDAYVTWAVGIILALILFMTKQIIAGVAAIIAGGILGLVTMAISELCQNIADIAASLQSMTITQTDYRND